MDTPKEALAMGTRRKIICLWTGAVMPLAACGYKAKDASDLTADHGQVVGVLVDDKGKAHPDATVTLFRADGTSALVSNNMDSDGSFVLYPPAAGTYNVIGTIGDTQKVIKQGVVMDDAMDGVNIGQLQGATVAGLAVQVTTPDGTDPSGVAIEVLGTDVHGETIEQGAGALAGIPAGTYVLRFSRADLQTVAQSGIAFAAGEAKVLEKVTLVAGAAAR